MDMTASKILYDLGKYQKGENDIEYTYPNADKAVRAILKRLQD